MKYSHKLSDAVHVLTYVEMGQDHPELDLSSNGIALSIESNASLVRRLMSSLVKAGLLATRPGIAAPTLARPANEITLLEVYYAIDEDHNLLHVDDKTNMDCPVGANIQGALNTAYRKVQQQAEASMDGITLDQIIEDVEVSQAKKDLLK